MYYKKLSNVCIATVVPRCGRSESYQPQVLRKLRRHVSKLIVIVPAEDQGSTLDQHSLSNDDVQDAKVSEEPIEGNDVPR